MNQIETFSTPELKVIQFYLGCLSHASYLIADTGTGRAIVVDPQRDINQYVTAANDAGFTIELVVETHFHADFLSGHLELVAATGAEIVYSSVAETDFASRKVADGERHALGSVVLEFLHTPGHTPESLSVVIYPSDDHPPYGVLTGDTLFIGDVGRPDLLASFGVSQDDLASDLFDSLHDKLVGPLPNSTLVFPAHGAGSACGKNLSTELSSTIGDQKATNYALQITDRSRFIEIITEGQPAAPQYFSYDATLNRQQRPLHDQDRPVAPLDLPAFDDHVAAGAIMLDTRPHETFARGHLVGSINVPIEGRYAEYAGSVLTPDRPIVLISEPGSASEARNRLARIGFDNVLGALNTPRQVMTDNPERVRHASRLTPARFNERNATLSNLQVVDVRTENETATGFVDGAYTLPISELPSRLNELDPTAPTVVYCAGGYRSSVAASLLRSVGFDDVSDILGGYGALVEGGVNG